MKLSKTMQALHLVDQGMKVREAAKQIGVSEQAVYTAKKRQADSVALGKVRCPCCNSLVMSDRINQEVLNCDEIAFSTKESAADTGRVQKCKATMAV